MDKTRLYRSLFFISLAITLIGSELYRPYAWSNNFNDFGLAGSCTNITAVSVASFLFMAKENYLEHKKNIEIILGTAIGFVVYEIMQVYLPWGTFDWKDIAGTIIGGALTLGIYSIINSQSGIKNQSS